MLDIALHVGAVLLVLAAFGLPVALLVSPDEWRRWWPVSLPVLGLAGLAAVQLPLGTVASPGDTAIPAILVSSCAGVFLWRRFNGLPRPSIMSLVVLLAVVPAGLMSYRPTLRLQEPRPSGVLNEDSVYYLGIDTWLMEHGIRDEPPKPSVDGFYATAHQAWDNNLRVGVDLLNVQTARLLGVDPLETLPAVTASLVGLIGMGAALAVVALRGPPWGAALVALLLTTRPETVRLGIDSFVAQAAGVALAPAAASALAMALLRGGMRWIITAGLLAGTLGAYYVEYAPWLTISGMLMAAALLSFPGLIGAWDATRSSSASLARRVICIRAALIAGSCLLLNPLAVYNGIRSLSVGTNLSGESIVPFFGLLRDLGLVTGPFSVLYLAPEASLFLAAAATATVGMGLLHLPERSMVAIGGTLGAVIAFALHQAYVQDYSYGLYKVLGLAAPVVAITLVLVAGYRRMPLGIRTATGLVIVGLIAVNVPAAIDVSRASIGAVNGMVPDDAELAALPSLLPDSRSVALENTDTAGTPNARQHYGVYFLRAINGQRVTYARGPGSYYATALTEGPAAVDRTYSPTYDAVVSWGPSLTHDDLVGRLDGWHVYERDAGPDLLLVGRTGWVFPTVAPDGRPMRWTEGPATLWVNAPSAMTVRLNLEVMAPFRRQALEVRLADRVVSRVSVPTAVTSLRTATVTVPRGRSVVSLVSSPQPSPDGGDRLGVGVVSARVVRVR